LFFVRIEFSQKNVYVRKKRDNKPESLDTSYAGASLNKIIIIKPSKNYLI